MVQLLAEALFIYLFSKTSILALGPTQRTGELVSCGRVDRMWTGCGQDVDRMWTGCGTHHSSPF